MPFYDVSLGKEVAYNEFVRVFAADEEAALTEALAAVTADDWEEGDWESGIECIEVIEADEADSMNVYTSDDGATFTIVPIIDDVEDWTQAYEVDRREDIPEGAHHVSRNV